MPRSTLYRGHSKCRLIHAGLFARAGAIPAQAALPGFLLVNLVYPTAAQIFVPVETVDDRFNIEKRRAVEDVDIFDVEDIALYTGQAAYAEADGVGAARGAGRKKPPLDIVEKRQEFQFRRPGAVEMIDEKDVRKPVQVGKPLDAFRENFYPSFYPFREFRLGGGLLRLRVRAVDYSDRRVFNLHRISFPLDIELDTSYSIDTRTPVKGYGMNAGEFLNEQFENISNRTGKDGKPATIYIYLRETGESAEITHYSTRGGDTYWDGVKVEPIVVASPQWETPEEAAAARGAIEHVINGEITARYGSN